MRVLVIPEDFSQDQHILKPLIAAMLKAVGRPHATIRIHNPKRGGIGEALKTANITEILHDYKGMVDLFLLCVDRDAEEHRRQQLDNVEAHAQTLLPPRRAAWRR